MVAVAGGGPAGLAVKFRIGDGDRAALVFGKYRSMERG
jgi:NADPH-dependent glutamate synthase beta subunit-like oxidoreductase